MNCICRYGLVQKRGATTHKFILEFEEKKPSQSRGFDEPLSCAREQSTEGLLAGHCTRSGCVLVVLTVELAPAAPVWATTYSGSASLSQRPHGD